MRSLIGTIGRCEAARIVAFSAAMIIPNWGAIVAVPQSAASPVDEQDAVPGRRNVAIWELSPARMNAMLDASPDGNEKRYEALRQDFEDSGCVGSAMEEERVDRKGHSRNIVCTIAGEERRAIVILARYDERLVFFDAKGGWADAVLLPILYHALSAEPHHKTLVFAAVDQTRGAAYFYKAMRARGDPVPVVEVDLEGLGLTMPQFFAATPALLPVKERATAQAVVGMAFSVAALQRKNGDASWFGSTPFFSVQPSALSAGREPLGCPVVSVFSGIGGSVTPEYFREAHDFVGLFVGGLDKVLAGE